jgi:cytochrome c-type protein NapB
VSSAPPTSEDPGSTEARPASSRSIQIAAALVVGVAFVGFFTGTRGGPAPTVWGAVDRDGATVGTATPAPSHAELAADEWRWMGARQRAALASMSQAPAARDEAAPSDEARDEAIRARAARRAYDGAPPRIPHAMPARGALACLACHEEGLRVATLRAPAMSHEHTAVCVSCHVEDRAQVPGASEALTSGPPIDNRFVGLEAPQGGPRAWDGAPPVIPHPTRMRERCASCHGDLAEGLRSSHPYRQSCVQCHAPSARFDLQPAAELGPPAGGEWTP